MTYCDHIASNYTQHSSLAQLFKRTVETSLFILALNTDTKEEAVKQILCIPSTDT